MLRPQRPEAITLAAALFIAVALNGPFWGKLYAAVSPTTAFDWLFLGAVGAALVALFNLVLLAFSLRPLLRVLLTILLPTTAAASYFMHQYGVVIDVNTIRDIFQTDQAEAGDLMSIKMAAYILLLGVLPAVILWRVRWLERPFAHDSKAKLKAAALSLAVIALAIAPFFGEFLSVFRETPQLRLTLTPTNYIAAVTKYARKREGKAKEMAAVGRDAERMPEPNARPHLFVIVVGETARAANFSLNGYARDTNPELRKVSELINFPNARSCGTDTAESVPCMFSGLTQSDFTNTKAAVRENLLDVLRHGGVDVLWRDNQSGCKGVCDRVSTETLTGMAHPTFYASTGNFDEILLDGLETRVGQIRRDTVVVLHMMGSHGPAYWKRYPAAFERFTPACKDAQFSHCTTEEIVNAYDNTILYTDHVLARLISILSGAEGVEAGMIYLSDHGESLGEHGIYLHGMPYALAPREQTQVPFMTWLSPSLRADNGIADGCLEAQASAPVSHDNLFHSVLGIMDIATTQYDSRLDIFARCTHHPS